MNLKQLKIIECMHSDWPLDDCPICCGVTTTTSGVSELHTAEDILMFDDDPEVRASVVASGSRFHQGPR